MQQQRQDEAQRQHERNERNAEMVRLQQVAISNLHKPESKGPKDLTSAELNSLKSSFEPHLIADWD